MWYNTNMDEYNEHKISELVKDKTIESVYNKYDYPNDSIVINFTDGAQLEIEYDWIYEVKLNDV